MKYLTLLLPLFATAAKAETIVMACGSEAMLYKYETSVLGDKGWYRHDGRWIPACEPKEWVDRDTGEDTRRVCRVSDKSIQWTVQVKRNGVWQKKYARKDGVADFVALEFDTGLDHVMRCKKR